jgi:hypothetical protein
MTATYAVDEQPHRHPLLPGAQPHAIREHLLPEDQPLFEAAYEQALADAKKSMDLTGLFETLEQWRCAAVLQSDPAKFRHAVRRAAELLTGQPVPEDEPFSVTRRKAGM